MSVICIMVQYTSIKHNELVYPENFLCKNDILFVNFPIVGYNYC